MEVSPNPSLWPGSRPSLSVLCSFSQTDDPSHKALLSNRDSPLYVNWRRDVVSRSCSSDIAVATTAFDCLSGHRRSLPSALAGICSPHIRACSLHPVILTLWPVSKSGRATSSASVPGYGPSGKILPGLTTTEHDPPSMKGIAISGTACTAAAPPSCLRESRGSVCSCS